MMHMTHNRTLLLGLLIIAITNAVALGGVAYNRSGEPTSSLTMTERELGLPYNYGFERENSGIALQLRWRVYDSTNESDYSYYTGWTSTEWLDADKLAALGFDVSYPLNLANSHEHYLKAVRREVLVVLEYDGPAYQMALQQRNEKLVEAEHLTLQNPDKEEFKKRLKTARASLSAEQQERSRLFVVDAGLEYNVLRQQYSDQTKYLVARGQVDLRYHGSYDKAPYLRGSIVKLSVAEMNVPLAQAAVLTPLLEKAYRRRGEQLPRYEVKLHYGQRYEPWVISVKDL
jgi:uncharacterized membrane protein